MKIKFNHLKNIETETEAINRSKRTINAFRNSNIQELVNRASRIEQCINGIKTCYDLFCSKCKRDFRINYVNKLSSVYKNDDLYVVTLFEPFYGEETTKVDIYRMKDNFRVWLIRNFKDYHIEICGALDVSWTVVCNTDGYPCFHWHLIIKTNCPKNILSKKLKSKFIQTEWIYRPVLIKEIERMSDNKIPTFSYYGLAPYFPRVCKYFDETNCPKKIEQTLSLKELCFLAYILPEKMSEMTFFFNVNNKIKSNQLCTVNHCSNKGLIVSNINKIQELK